MSKISDTLNRVNKRDYLKELNAAYNDLIGPFSHFCGAQCNCKDFVPKDECESKDDSDLDIFKDTYIGSTEKSYEWEDRRVNDTDLTKKSKEMVNHPSHYKGKKFEVIDIIEDYNLGFNLGNAVKYILRAGHKDSYVQDLKKAVWYLNREINYGS